MSITSILLALIPAFGWGILPILLRKVGGDTTNQILGFGLGAVLVGLIVQFAFHPASINFPTFAIAFASGALWVIGQAGQVSAFNIIGVSKTMPISTGLQLVGTSVIGVLAFGEWPSVMDKVLGFIAIALLILGAYLTSRESNASADGTNSQLVRGLRLLTLTSIGYWIYSVAPRLVDADGLSIFLPQMAGILTGAIIYVLATRRSAFTEKESWKAAGVGVVFGIASLSYIFSAQANGVNMAFILSQLNVVIATLGAIFILREKKAPADMRTTYLGLAILIIASIMTIL